MSRGEAVNGLSSLSLHSARVRGVSGCGRGASSSLIFDVGRGVGIAFQDVSAAILNGPHEAGTH